ncbi:unnamed protein product [Acanthoscelides obtectus]|uniref:Uncharacterized protein n=1 Tax=Acanthoscelides obtectus TaxID=200917 RepID=A0A9P0M2M9_ACAOB|nr:unnamed protein product [Acanthoscelides obtectus]CAK1647741.1 hypothetical protein AOBTE_LOCUS15375 [Acanthoscelides obtectus]
MEEMELTIARLVLGYLKSEHCRSAYKEFLKTCPHLQQNNISKSKFLRTRFLGLSLEEIIHEYVDIYHMVQARLEATNYFQEHHHKQNLLSQILYLFNKVPTIDISRTSTPCIRSPRESNLDEASPFSYIEHASDVETTPVHTLPGNICSGNHERGPKKSAKKAARSPRIEDEEVQSRDGDQTPTSAELVNTEVLAQTLLENKEFHEKIAQTINKVVENQHRDSGELDKTVKTVVKETEEDPIFDKLLDEIIGSAALIDNVRFEPNKSSNRDGIAITSSNNNKKQDGSNGSSKSVSREDEIHKQNGEAINCIVANSTEKMQAQVPSSQVPPNGEVIVFDGSLDNFMNSNMCTAPTAPVTTVPSIQNQFYTTGLLITTGANTATMATLTNKPIQVPLLLTEQDILSMPTVIVSDNQTNTVKKTSELKQIKPRLTPRNAPTILPNFAPSENPPKQLGLKKVVYPVVSSSSMVTSTPAATSNTQSSLPQLMNEEEKQDLPEDDVEVVAPPVTPPALDNMQKVTPKSASHVRNLDFSTPPKINKKDLEPNASTKQVTKTLFPKKPKEVLVELGKTWDADLRARAASEEASSRTPKRKRKKPLSGKKSKKAKTSITDEDGVALEAALKTPKKSSQEKKTENEQSNINTDKQSTTMEPIPDSQIEALSITEIHTKTILSPSKMNATKRSLVNTDPNESSSRFITPDNVQEAATAQPMKANRNIIPMLETPMKEYFPPKTPGVHTPMDLNLSTMSSNITPFTKMLEANLKGLDINQIPTPNIPITPNFPPFTPNIDLVSPYSNRPTDYSASSSYYQPSDNEQNKSLETQLRELEKKSDDNERLKSFKKNVIGGKNLNLMKRTVLSSSSSGDDSDSSNNDDYRESNDTVIFKKSRSPVQSKYSLRTRNVDKSKSETKKTPKKAVRRKAKNKEKADGSVKDNDVKESEDDKVEPGAVDVGEVKITKETASIETTQTRELTISCKLETIRIDIETLPSPTKPKKSKTPKKNSTKDDQSKSTLTASQLSLRKELEEKKKRMLSNIRGDSKEQKPGKKQNSGFKIKPIANLTNSKRKPRKAATPKKTVQTDKEDLRLVMEDLEHSDDSDDEVPLAFKKANLLAPEVISSDVEAQTLIEGLKERGIHLMHNKSPKKKGQEDADDENEDQGTEKVEDNTVNDTKEGSAAKRNSSIIEFDSYRDEEFSVQVFEDFTKTVVYDENDCSRKPLQVEAITELKTKKRSAEVFVEEINDFVRLNIVFTPLYATFEFGITDSEEVSEQQSTTPAKTDVEPNPQETSPDDQNASMRNDAKVDSRAMQKDSLELDDEKPDDDLMNFAVTGCDREESTDAHSTSSKKRKVKNEENTRSGKKCSTLLKKIDVDVFLDGIHGLDK